MRSCPAGHAGTLSLSDVFTRDLITACGRSFPKGEAKEPHVNITAFPRISLFGTVKTVPYGELRNIPHSEFRIGIIPHYPFSWRFR